MAISLCSALALVALLQAPPPPPPPADSLATPRGRATQDSTDAQMWLLMGRAYLGLGVEAHGATHRSSEDSAWTRAVLDTAEEALARAAALAGPLGSSAVGDSARVLRVGAWAVRSWLGWESGGVDAGVDAWGPLPMDLRVPPVLDELGENLLRACPARRAGTAAPGVRKHGLRAASRNAPAHPVGDPAARVGGRTGGEEPAGAAARLRVRGAARGARRKRPLGRTRPRRLQPGGAHD